MWRGNLQGRHAARCLIVSCWPLRLPIASSRALPGGCTAPPAMSFHSWTRSSCLALPRSTACNVGTHAIQRQHAARLLQLRAAGVATSGSSAAGLSLAGNSAGSTSSSVLFVSPVWPERSSSAAGELWRPVYACLMPPCVHHYPTDADAQHHKPPSISRRAHQRPYRLLPLSRVAGGVRKPQLPQRACSGARGGRRADARAAAQPAGAARSSAGRGSAHRRHLRSLLRRGSVQLPRARSGAARAALPGHAGLPRFARRAAGAGRARRLAGRHPGLPPRCSRPRLPARAGSHSPVRGGVRWGGAGRLPAVCTLVSRRTPLGLWPALSRAGPATRAPTAARRCHPLLQIRPHTGVLASGAAHADAPVRRASRKAGAGTLLCPAFTARAHSSSGGACVGSLPAARSTAALLHDRQLAAPTKLGLGTLGLCRGVARSARCAAARAARHSRAPPLRGVPSWRRAAAAQACELPGMGGKPNRCCSLNEPRQC